MKTRKTMSEINQAKWARMRLILDKLKEQPMTFNEIVRLVYKKGSKIAKRTAQNYIAELVALGFVTYDSEAKIYGLTGTMKKEFQSKHNYDLALKHSKNLVSSTSEKQRFDQMDPFLALDLLAFHDINPCPDVDDECFVQHLKTGYFKDVYVLMQKYRQLMDETGFSRYLGFPKYFSSFEEPFGSSQTPQELVSRVAAHKEAKHMEKDKIKEIENLRNLLVGKIYSIVNEVANGIPLQGYCEYCPDRKVTIKSKFC
jgi:predicted transcriptional regulator